MLETSGFAVEETMWHAGRYLTFAAEWLDLREVYPYVAALATVASPADLAPIREDMIQHFSDLIVSAHAARLFEATEDDATYLLVKARAV